MHAQSEHSAALATELEVYALGSWTVHHYATAGSTNLLAANLPAWSAVRADVQSSGRGRFQRRWVSDKGGLWLSAVLPSNSISAGVLPFAVGLAVCDTLRESRLRDLRMRWPN